MASAVHRSAWVAAGRCTRCQRSFAQVTLGMAVHDDSMLWTAGAREDGQAVELQPSWPRYRDDGTKLRQPTPASFRPDRHFDRDKMRTFAHF